MNKAQLIDAMAEKAGLTKADAKKALDSFISATSESLKEGDRVALVGFGSFSVSERAARKGRNPQKPNQVIDIPAKNVVKFSAGSDLKAAVK
jgi:DNA-binding protein HU-beta